MTTILCSHDYSVWSSHALSNRPRCQTRSHSGQPISSRHKSTVQIIFDINLCSKLAINVSCSLLQLLIVSLIAVQEISSQQWRKHKMNTDIHDDWNSNPEQDWKASHRRWHWTQGNFSFTSPELTRLAWAWDSHSEFLELCCFSNWKSMILIGRKTCRNRGKSSKKIRRGTLDILYAPLETE